MRIAITTTLLVSSTFLFSCGGSADSEADADMGMDDPAGDVELTGQFELSSAAPFNFSAQGIEFRCQPVAGPAAFRAMWTDTGTGTFVTVTGWPVEGDQGEMRLDTFRVYQQTPEGNTTTARLTSATLNIEELSSRGAVSTYAVEATGVFDDGGTFVASGHCLA